MEIRKILWLKRDVIARLTSLLNENSSEFLGEDDTIVYTIVFGLGMEMDIKICGVQPVDDEPNTAWSEAVLFRNGVEIACTEPDDSILGTWSIHADGIEYVVEVKEIPENLSTTEFVEYVRENFDIDCDAIRMLENLLSALPGLGLSSEKTLEFLDRVLDGLGIERVEIAALDMCGGNNK